MAAHNPNRQRFITAVGKLERDEDIIGLCAEYPELMKMRHNGQTLLHQAIIHGRAATVHQLLALRGSAGRVFDEVNPWGDDRRFIDMDAMALAEHMQKQHAGTERAAEYAAIRDTVAAECAGQAAFMAAIAGPTGFIDTPDALHDRIALIDKTLAAHPGYLDAPEHGMRPLSLAAWKGQAEIVRHLLHKGANPFLETESGHYKGLTPRAMLEQELTQSKSRGSELTAPYREIVGMLTEAETAWEEAGKPKQPFVDRVMDRGDSDRNMGGVRGAS